MTISTKIFNRLKEDFHCENCGQFTTGDGYTNHCPYCLWSKHVDVNPGDRMEQCHGLMEPIDIRITGKREILSQRCVRCGVQKVINLTERDNRDAVYALCRSLNQAKQGL